MDAGLFDVLHDAGDEDAFAIAQCVDGDFNGTIHSNSVKLQATATVEGEIFKQSLVIEQNAQFEGVARRLTTAPKRRRAAFRAG